MESSLTKGEGVPDCFFFLIAIHSMQVLTATISHGHGVRRKRSTKKITGNRKSVQTECTVKRCLLILDVKPLRS